MDNAPQPPTWIWDVAQDSAQLYEYFTVTTAISPSPNKMKVAILDWIALSQPK